MPFRLLSTLVGMVGILLMLSSEFDLFAGILDFLLVEALDVDLGGGVRARIEQWGP